MESDPFKFNLIPNKRLSTKTVCIECKYFAPDNSRVWTRIKKTRIFSFRFPFIKTHKEKYYTEKAIKYGSCSNAIVECSFGGRNIKKPIHAQTARDFPTLCGPQAIHFEQRSESIKTWD